MSYFLKPLVLAAAFSTSLMGTAVVAQDNPMAEAMSNVTNVALDLQDTVAQLQDNIASSANSAEEGTRMLNEMLEAARNVNDSLNKDSAVWTELNALLTEWGNKRDETIEKSAENPALKGVAELWQDRIDQGISLRTQILDQASTSFNLAADIEAQREVVLAYFEVGAAEQVLASMQQISDQLGQMNTEMQSILTQAGVELPAVGVSQ